MKKRDVVIVPQDEDERASLDLLRYVTFDAELGRFLVVRSEKGLRAVTFAKELDVEGELARLTKNRHSMAVEDRISLRRVVDDIRDYLGGRPVVFDYALDLAGVTPFGRRVLDVVSGVPFGTLRSYKWVAREIGSPRATRPVGQSLARNPLPIVVPCHRIVNSNGTLGGYSGGGPDMKRRLIEIENGQIGLALRSGERERREHIRFILESEAGGDDGAEGKA